MVSVINHHIDASMVVDVMNSALCVNTDSTEFKLFAINMTRGEARMVEGIEINLIAY